MVTALDVAQALGYLLLVGGFALWVTLSSAGRVNGRGIRRRTPRIGSPSPRGTCATRRTPRRRP
jgi:hypothetical protein